VRKYTGVARRWWDNRGEISLAYGADKHITYMLARINQRQSHLIAPILAIITILFVASAPVSCISHTVARMELEREDRALRRH
jgi:hypothetical protein